ncbi:hypothetical protein GQ53DRAFT_812180 [Thozetella sp. PMI_491]|nr:hypothetical protein GQ53DRAFT_812180 [Thozetella sp. PMI_491]
MTSWLAHSMAGQAECAAGWPLAQSRKIHPPSPLQLPPVADAVVLPAKTNPIHPAQPRTPTPANLASGQAAAASPGAHIASLANITSSLLVKLPPPLRSYLDTAILYLASASAYLQSLTGLPPAVLYATAAAILVLGAVPTVRARAAQNRAAASKGKTKMSRYGYSNREGISPFNSSIGQGVPAVTDDDFSYITSEDLEVHGLDIPRRRGEMYNDHHYARSAPGFEDNPEEDDVLLLKVKGVIYPTKFPAYSIGDGKLLVCDLRDRIRVTMKLSERRARKMRMLYKGFQLSESTAPVRDYGVKNNSEVMVVLDDGAADSDSESSEEIVIVGQEEDEPSRRRNKKKRGSKKQSKRSPRDSRSSLGLDVPQDDGRRASSRSRAPSPGSAVSAGSSAVSGVSGVPGVPGGPIEKMNAIASHFNTVLLPVCVQYTANPPSDPKKRVDEHRKISETVMQQVILKLDELDTSSEEGARARRKELVRHVQDVLKALDDAKARG